MEEIDAKAANTFFIRRISHRVNPHDYESGIRELLYKLQPEWKGERLIVKVLLLIEHNTNTLSARYNATFEHMTVHYD